MRRIRKKWEKPRKRWDKARIEEEKRLMEKYGLRRKHEIWKAEGLLRKYRRIARQLIARYDEKLHKQIVSRLYRLGIINNPNATPDDILKLTVEDFLARRLQTVVYAKGLANTPKQARQLIVHGHIMVGDRKVRFPSYLVKRGEEDKIKLLLDPAKLGLKQKVSGNGEAS